MKIDVKNRCSDFDSYRAARCKSLFNVESGCDFDLSADLPIDDDDWSIGLILGPSGSGKTSMGLKIFGPEAVFDPEDWPSDKPIIDAIAPGAEFDTVTTALSSVGLGSVPTWLRPFSVLSNGEKFRANMARLVCEAPDRVVVDEFTSVVDRQVAQVGAYAFSKAWRRAASGSVKKCVLLSCHYDIVDWLEPDWVFDIFTGQYQGRCLWRRPAVTVDLFETTSWWHWENLFKKHHYLKVGPMPAAKVYIAEVEGTPVFHSAMAPKPKGRNAIEARGGRLVVMPEWQGMHVAQSVAKEVFKLQMRGEGCVKGRSLSSLVTTSHPGMIKARRRDPEFVCVKTVLHGQNRGLVAKSKTRRTTNKKAAAGFVRFGGHFRSTATFRYVGDGSIKYER